MAMVQYGLWPNCTNDCDFCLLEDRVYKSKKERLRVLTAIKENIKIVDWKNKFRNGISLLGGEVFYTDSEEVKESFLDLICKIIDIVFQQSNSTRLSIVSNGIYDSKILLEPTLDLLNEKGVLSRLDLNFSYDMKYRFHNQESLNKMIKNTNLVYDKYGIFPCVQTCLTQCVIDAYLNNTFDIFKFKEENFPNSELTFLYPHKINTGKTLDDFFFKRSSLIRFIKRLKQDGHNDTVQHFIQSVINSSQFKYTGLFDRLDILEGDDTRALQEPTLEKKQILTECGHSQLYRCYADSNKCMLCDLLKLI